MLGQNWSVLFISRRLGAHFGLSSLVGWAGYSLTSTIQYLTGYQVKLLGQSINLLPFLLALSFALLSHLVEDYTINRF
jgi:hypothetical protein